MFSPDFFRCTRCGNLIWKVRDSSIPVVCCGIPMHRLAPGETDGSVEKHVPCVSDVNGSLRVEVGTEPHPTLEEHHILWIALMTDTGLYFRSIPAGEPAAADFDKALGNPITAYAYCSLHGLWKAEIMPAGARISDF